MYDFSLYFYVAPVLTRVFFGGNEKSLVLTFAPANRRGFATS